MKACLVNVAIGARYPFGQERLVNSFKKFGWPGDYLLYTNQYPVGCPTHQEVPYAFKIHAMEEAARKGYDVIMWADASFWTVASLDPFIHAVETDGHALWIGGYSVGDWCSDNGLRQLGLTRDEAMLLPLFVGGLWGLDLRVERSREFLRLMGVSARDTTFVGPWDNKEKKASQDPRCLGHRHDQPPMAVHAHRLGMKHRVPRDMFAYYYDNQPIVPGVFLVCQGV